MQPNPKTLILNLLQAADGAPLSAAAAVGSCELFDISENSTRVALARLGAAGLIESAGRGNYRLGAKAAGLAQELSRWRDAESRVGQWSGKWIMVSTSSLGRSDRSALRIRQRALALLGFQELSANLFVRPDNLLGHVDSARERLRKLGLQGDAPVFAATELDPSMEARARGLWQGKALSQAYVQTRHQLQAWLDGAHQLTPEAAARECYLLGNEAVRQLVFDPLLPEPLVNTAERRAFTNTVIAFDEAGQRIWRALLASR